MDWAPLLCFVVATGFALLFVLPDRHAPMMAEVIAAAYFATTALGFMLGAGRQGRNTPRVIGALLCVLLLFVGLVIALLAMSVYKNLN